MQCKNWKTDLVANLQLLMLISKNVLSDDIVKEKSKFFSNLINEVTCFESVYKYYHPKSSPFVDDIVGRIVKNRLPTRYHEPFISHLTSKNSLNKPETHFKELISFLDKKVKMWQFELGNAICQTSHDINIHVTHNNELNTFAVKNDGHNFLDNNVTSSFN